MKCVANIVKLRVIFLNSQLLTIVKFTNRRKYVIRIAQNPFVYIYFLPELACEKCKQTRFRAILVQYFWEQEKTSGILL